MVLFAKCGLDNFKTNLGLMLRPLSPLLSSTPSARRSTFNSLLNYGP